MIHGAGDSSWHWHLVEPELRRLGHEVVTMDLPCEDDGAGLAEYADAVVDAIGDAKDVVLVAQSFGGFTAPLVCERVPVDLMVLVAAMIPAPGEAASDYWANTQWSPPKVKVDHLGGMSEEDAWTVAAFMHDVPSEIVKEALNRERGQSDTPAKEPWPLDAWPDVATKFLLCRDDQFFQPQWMRTVVEERLGMTPDEMNGSHCVALSRPKELADGLHGYLP
jgi:pimeloyl-ACP methyl ester carboxylesterase